MVEFDFYEQTYFGDIIPSESFPKMESRAVDELKLMTRGEITGEEDYEKKAVCAVAEQLYLIEQERTRTGTDKEGKGKVIKSKTSGDESISYEIQKSAVQEALTSNQARNELLYSTARVYLTGTGLLFWGI